MSLLLQCCASLLMRWILPEFASDFACPYEKCFTSLPARYLQWGGSTPPVDYTAVQERLRIESSALQEEAKWCPQHVPAV
jgi:hypothetical protein